MQQLCSIDIDVLLGKLVGKGHALGRDAHGRFACWMRDTNEARGDVRQHQAFVVEACDLGDLDD